uniref:Uncharacterized protein n=1 Tax=Oryza nivara TaxID=4536 RepID=A0A0E0IKL6_ORYNI
MENLSADRRSIREANHKLVYMRVGGGLLGIGRSLDGDVVLEAAGSARQRSATHSGDQFNLVLGFLLKPAMGAPLAELLQKKNKPNKNPKKKGRERERERERKKQSTGTGGSEAKVKA